MGSTTPLRFYFDVISPYAYLGWTQLSRLAVRIERDIEPVPVLFAAMLNEHGHKGPAEIPPKRLYTFKHVARLAHGLGVPLHAPPSHPFSPLLALRLASLPLAPEQRVAVIDLLMQRAWATGLGVTDEHSVARALDCAGLPGQELCARASRSETKQALRDQTDRALAIGVFGVPSYELDGEVFWGTDAQPHIVAFAEGADTVDAGELERWRTLPVGSRR